MLDIGEPQPDAGSAGHPPVLIRRADGKVEEVGEEIAGFPLGIMPDSDYQQTEVRLNPGDVVVIYSDGVTDARNLREELYDSRENRACCAGWPRPPAGPRPSAARSSRTSASSPPATPRSTTSP